MIVKNGRDLPIEQVTSENYVVPRGEEMVYHVKIEVKQFNAKTGERISRPRIQKFGMKTWQGSVRDSLHKQGYTIDVLHDPTIWVEKNRGRMESQKAAAKEAEKAAWKEEILAELKAQGFVLARPEEVKDENEMAALKEEILAKQKAQEVKEEAENVDDADVFEKKVGRPRKS